MCAYPHIITTFVKILHQFKQKKFSNPDQCRMAGSDLKPICQPESPQAPLYVDRRSLCEQAQLTEVLLFTI